VTNSLSNLKKRNLFLATFAFQFYPLRYERTAKQKQQQKPKQKHWQNKASKIIVCHLQIKIIFTKYITKPECLEKSLNKFLIANFKSFILRMPNNST
jgi:hypothetical protein